MKTISLRLDQHSKNAMIIAKWLNKRTEVKEIFYPALKGDKGYAIWKRDFIGASGVFSFLLDLKYSKTSIESMINSLKFFGLGHSWGGFESLLIPVQDPSEYRIKKSWNKKGHLIRINIGLEDPKDLIFDLKKAFCKLHEVY